MVLPNGVSPSRLAPKFNIIHTSNLEQQHEDATAMAAADQPGNNNQAHQNQGNEFTLARVSSTINVPGFWLDKPYT